MNIPADSGRLLSTQCYFIVGPPSATMSQRQCFQVSLPYIASDIRVCTKQDLWQMFEEISEAVFCLFYLRNFEYICH